MYKNKCDEIERNDNRNRYSDSTTTNNLREKEKKIILKDLRKNL